LFSVAMDQVRSGLCTSDDDSRPGAAHGDPRCDASGAESLARLVEGLIERLGGLHEAGGAQVPGISTGFRELDRLTTGMHRGELFVVAARPGMGKSSFALTVAQHVAVELGLPVVVFSLEMDSQQLVERLASLCGGIAHQVVRTGALRDADWVRLSEVEDLPVPTLEELTARARERSIQVGRLGLVVVDYLQLIGGQAPANDTRAAELSGISRGLKALARELRCPLLAVSQLNRAPETRRNRRPMLADLRDSGAIEEDADVVLFIYREDYYAGEQKGTPSVTEVIVGKQRNGPVGSLWLAFDREHTRFENPP
jgi:replicative DNA helicase